MTRADNDDEVRGEAISDGPYQSHIPPHTHCQSEDEEPYHHHGQQIGGGGKTETHQRVDPREESARGIGGSYLEGRHSGEYRVGPACCFSRSLSECFGLLAYGDTLLSVILAQDIALQCVGIKIDDCYGSDSHNGDDDAPQRVGAKISV